MPRYTIRVSLIEVGDTPHETRHIASENLPPVTDSTKAQTIYNQTVNSAVQHHHYVITGLGGESA